MILPWVLYIISLFHIWQQHANGHWYCKYMPPTPVELRRTVTMECEVQIPVQVQGPVNTIEVEALLDSGATRCFVDKSWAFDR